MLVALESDMHKENRLSQELLLDKDSLEKLKTTCAEKIRGAADSQILPGHPKLRSLLGFWTEWGRLEEAKVWVDQFTG